MKKLFQKISASIEKVPIVAYIFNSLVKCFFIVTGAVGIIFVLLWTTGIYAKMETAMDLKYNSPVFLVFIAVFAALFVLCFLAGFLRYFNKYKRPKSKSVFFNAVAPALEQRMDQRKGLTDEAKIH